MPAKKQTPPRPIDRLRTFVALCCASGVTLLCLYLHHFDWDITSAWSFVLMFRHHCGKLLMLFCLWAFIESILLLADYAFAAPPAKVFLEKPST